ncbi:MAG: Fe-S cluster assembly sulfur transfer protein SufU, partial [Myxococcota bacterium]
MMSDLRELYQEVILDHNRKPLNFREIPDADAKAEGFNPLCGDHLNLFVKLDGDVITDVAFQGTGCAISKASASMMTASVAGKTKQEAGKLFDLFHDMVTGEPGSQADAAELGKLAVFSGVCEFPARVKCA